MRLMQSALALAISIIELALLSILIMISNFKLMTLKNTNFQYLKLVQKNIVNAVHDSIYNYHRMSVWQPCVLGSIVVSIPACHAGDRGSIPRRGEHIFALLLSLLLCSPSWKSVFHHLLVCR